MRWVTWIIAPLVGLAGAVVIGWWSDADSTYWLGAALAPTVTLAYGALRGVPPSRGLSSAAISFALALVLITLALAVLLFFLLDFSDFD